MRISDWSSDVCSSDLFRVEQDPLHGDYAFIGLEWDEKRGMLFARFWRPDDATRGEADLEARGVDRAGTQIAFARGAGDWHGRIPKLERQLAARRLGRVQIGRATV